MLNGLKNTEIVFEILKDGRPHYSREFLDAGLCEYRRRVTDLREKGYNIQSVRIQDPISKFKRPGYQLIWPTQEKQLEMNFNGEAA